MDRQAFYNKTRDHLLTQGRKSARVYPGLESKYELGTPVEDMNPDDIQCRYRAPQPDGTVLTCALGCHLRDEDYLQGFEGMRPSYSIKLPMMMTLAMALGAETQDDCAFMGELQDIHDENDPSEWGSLLKTFAVEHGLVP